MNVNYFWKDASGLNADIERHKKEEKDLEERINSLESKSELTKRDEIALRIYRNFLYLLHLSMSNVVSKIGRKKV